MWRNPYEKDLRGSEARSGPAKRRVRFAARDGKSVVWQHFTKIFTKDRGLVYAVCHFCDRVFHAPSKNGTSHLRRHSSKCSSNNATCLRPMLDLCEQLKMEETVDSLEVEKCSINNNTSIAADQEILHDLHPTLDLCKQQKMEETVDSLEVEKCSINNNTSTTADQEILRDLRTKFNLYKQQMEGADNFLEVNTSLTMLDPWNLPTSFYATTSLSQTHNGYWKEMKLTAIRIDPLSVPQYIGLKRTLEFYLLNGKKTNWIIIVYHQVDEHMPPYHFLQEDLMFHKLHKDVPYAFKELGGTLNADDNDKKLHKYQGMAAEEKLHLSVPKCTGLSYDEKMESDFSKYQPQLQQAFSPSFCFDFDLDKQDYVGGWVAKHTRDSGNSGDMEERCSGSTSSNIGEGCILEIKQVNIASGNKVAPQSPTTKQDALKAQTPKQIALKPLMPEKDALKALVPEHDALKHLMPKHMRKEWWIEDGQNKELLKLLANRNEATWDQVVVKVLNMIRCREFTEYNVKTDLVVPTRFCRYNIAFFDLDKESQIVPRPLISKITASSLWCLEHSVNVISIKIAESDVSYPIDIYGAVLARDQYDYRCIYLFKRGMDNPQTIMSPDDMLTLTGPFRALAVTDSMFFEFHLKIKKVEFVDQDLSKCLLEHNTSRHTGQPMTVSLKSCLSTVVMVYSPVSFAVEASLEVKVLNKASSFNGKVAAYTTENKNRMIMYDSEVSGTSIKLETGGSVALTRRIVSVPWDEGLVLDVSCKAECFEVTLWHEDDVEECTLTVGPCELQVKVFWTAVKRCRRPKMWEHIGDVDVLW